MKIEKYVQAKIVQELRKRFFAEWIKESQGYVYIHKETLERWLAEYEEGLLG